MATPMHQQLGRKEDHFNPHDGTTTLKPISSVDRLYDVSYAHVYKKGSAVTFEKITNRRVKPTDFTAQGSRLDYSPNFTVVEPESKGVKFGTAPRIISITPRGTEQQPEQPPQDDASGEFSEIPGSPTTGVSAGSPTAGRPSSAAPSTPGAPPNGPNKSAFIRPQSPTLSQPGITIPKTGRDLSYVKPQTDATPPPPDIPIDTLYAPIEKRRDHGGLISKTKKGTRFAIVQPDERNYNVSFDVTTLKPKVMVNMSRESGRIAAVQASACTPEANRAKLNLMLKKCERETAALQARARFLGQLPDPASRPPRSRGIDFYLAGGREENVCQGALPEPQTVINSFCWDVEGQTERLRHELTLAAKQAEMERKAAQRRVKLEMTSQELFDYRQSDDYKLKKHFKIYHDKEVTKLQEQLLGHVPSKVNTAGNMYRVGMAMQKRQMAQNMSATGSSCCGGSTGGYGGLVHSMVNAFYADAGSNRAPINTSLAGTTRGGHKTGGNTAPASPADYDDD